MRDFSDSHSCILNGNNMKKETLWGKNREEGSSIKLNTRVNKKNPSKLKSKCTYFKLLLLLPVENMYFKIMGGTSKLTGVA